MIPSATTEPPVYPRLEAGVVALECLAVYLGDRLGLYVALAAGPAAPAEVARRAQVDARYAREWLEQQAVAGLVAVEDPTATAEARVYRLDAATAAAMTGHQGAADDEAHLPLGGIGRVIRGIGQMLPTLIDAYRVGDGVPPAVYGEDLRAGVAGLNRRAFTEELASTWIPALPDVHARLLDGERSRVADIGCGAGWSSIALARAYPPVRVEGFDIDEASIHDARRNVAETEVADRISFEVADAAEIAPNGGYDLVCALDLIASVARPVEALQAMRGLCRPGAAVLVMTRRGGERSTDPAPGDLDERLAYALSVLHSLPVALADRSTAATGALLRPDTLRSYARQAGFGAVEAVPLDHARYRFFRLRP